MPERILTDLPLEIFWLVVKNLECETDINALSQVNRGLYNLLNPYLYRINIDSIYKSAISWGAYNGQEPTVRKALEQGAWAWFTWDRTLPKPITLAALRGHANIVKLLLNHGVNSNYSWENDDDGTESWSIMDWAHFELYSILDWPPWTAALACDHAEVLQILIEKNVFVPRAWDFFNAFGEGCFETLKVLVRACPEWAEFAQSEYSTILGLAINASWHNLDIARFLIDSGCPINYIDTNQHTPLVMAANTGNIETVRFLLDRGADPDPATPLWPLRFAAEKGHVEVAELLLERIDVQRKITGGGDDRFWLLYSAAACGFEKLVRACLDAGCNANRRLCVEHCSFSVDATNRLPDGGYNLTPLDWARGRGHSAVVRLLEDG